MLRRRTVLGVRIIIWSLLIVVRIVVRSFAGEVWGHAVVLRLHHNRCLAAKVEKAIFWQTYVAVVFVVRRIRALRAVGIVET